MSCDRDYHGTCKKWRGKGLHPTFLGAAALYAHAIVLSGISTYTNMTPFLNVNCCIRTHSNYTSTKRAYIIPKSLYSLSWSCICLLFVLKHAKKVDDDLLYPKQSTCYWIHSACQSNQHGICFKRGGKRGIQVEIKCLMVFTEYIGATVRPCTNLRPNWKASSRMSWPEIKKIAYKLEMQCYFSIWLSLFFSDPTHFCLWFVGWCLFRLVPG